MVITEINYRRQKLDKNVLLIEKQFLNHNMVLVFDEKSDFFLGQ